MSKECFGAAAARLSGAAAVFLGWLPDEFWEATPAELALALQSPAGPPGGPDLDVIAELRRRFPDE